MSVYVDSGEDQYSSAAHALPVDARPLRVSQAKGRMTQPTTQVGLSSVILRRTKIDLFARQKAAQDLLMFL